VLSKRRTVAYQCLFHSRPAAHMGGSSPHFDKKILKKIAKLLKLSKRGRSSEIPGSNTANDVKKKNTHAAISFTRSYL